MKPNTNTGFPVLLLAALVMTGMFMEVKCHDGVPSPCKNPTQQVYSKVKQKCVSLVGGYCDMVDNSGYSGSDNSTELLGENNISNNYTQCIGGAECKIQLYRFRNFLQSSHCACHSSFHTNRFRKCVIGFGDPCDVDNDELVCDESNHLTCVEGKCQCHDEYGYEYNEFSNSCVCKLEAFCNTKVSKDDPASLRCPYGAACYTQRDERFGNGVCLGREPFYIETANGTCQVNDLMVRYHSRSTGLQLAGGTILILSLMIVCSAA